MSQDPDGKEASVCADTGELSFQPSLDISLDKEDGTPKYNGVPFHTGSSDTSFHTCTSCAQRHKGGTPLSRHGHNLNEIHKVGCSLPRVLVRNP